MHLLLHKLKRQKVKVGMKRKAKATEETVQQILDEQLGNIPKGVAANLA